MTKNPPFIPHQVIADWIQSNDDHVLKDVPKHVITTLDNTEFDTSDYTFVSRQARKAQAEAIGLVFGGIGEKVKRFFSVAVPDMSNSFLVYIRASRRRRRALSELYQLSEGVLRDIGLTEGDVIAVARNRISLSELNEIRRSGWRY
jgi:uncharacterized protein YjiS (DUF1127 family)